MTLRNMSPQEMFVRMAAEHTPTHAFAGKSKKNVSTWKRKTRPKVLATLGDSPEAVDPNPQHVATWNHHGITTQRWIIDVAPHISATLLVNLPGGLGKNEKRPAILCCHGHGPFGKEPVMGNGTSPALREKIENHNYHYGLKMAQAGYVTYAIDWIGFGERNDSQKPNHHNQNGSRDWCNIYYLHATMLGMTSLSINVAHGKAATDFVCTLPQVDPTRLGTMGLSGGGTMTLWMSLCDRRFKATEIICYSDLWACFGIRDVNYCGMQVTPGLYKLVDLPDLQGLLVPSPLLVDIGANDTCFKVDSAMACYKKVKHIYKSAEAEDKLWLDLHEGEHGWGGNKSVDFFGTYL
ncbi:MAG: alpha/beta hydrolase family protein [Planctomycetota bacterium]